MHLTALCPDHHCMTLPWWLGQQRAHKRRAGLELPEREGHGFWFMNTSVLKDWILTCVWIHKFVLISKIFLR